MGENPSVCPLPLTAAGPVRSGARRGHARPLDEIMWGALALVVVLAEGGRSKRSERIELDVVREGA